MIIPVIVINLLIALFCLYAAWKVWRWGKNLSIAADALVRAEQSTHAVLSGAPEAISRGQSGTQQLRQQYRQLEFQIQQAQQILALTGLSQFVWRWYTRRRMGRSLRSQVANRRINRQSRRVG